MGIFFQSWDRFNFLARFRESRRTVDSRMWVQEKMEGNFFFEVLARSKQYFDVTCQFEMWMHGWISLVFSVVVLRTLVPRWASQHGRAVLVSCGRGLQLLWSGEFLLIPICTKTTHWGGAPFLRGLVLVYVSSQKLRKLNIAQHESWFRIGFGLSWVLVVGCGMGY